MRLVVCVGFLNEEEFLPTFLDTVAAQTRPPERMLLVDDGSTDRSAEIARDFAARHAWAEYVSRPPRPPERDRLAQAQEFKAFLWAREQVSDGYDVIAKMDADLRLNPHLMETVIAAFDADPRLGIAGGPLSVTGEGGEFEAEAQSESGSIVQPIWKQYHESSTWERPGLEWGTGFNFPEPGCWTITVTYGETIGMITLKVLGS